MNNFQSQEASFTPSPLYNNIFSAAKIAGIAAIISLAAALTGFIAIFLNPPPALAATGAAKEGFDEQSMQQLAQGSTYFFAFVSLAISALAFYFLYRFSNLAKAAAKSGNQPQMASALRSLGNYFKIWGIILFMVIIFFFLSLVGGMMGAFVGG